MAAKPRLNIRFDPDVLEGIRSAVDRGEAKDVTAFMETACRKALRMKAKPTPNGKATVERVREEAKRVTPRRAPSSSSARAGVRPIPKGSGKAKRK